MINIGDQQKIINVTYEMSVPLQQKSFSKNLPLPLLLRREAERLQ